MQHAEEMTRSSQYAARLTEVGGFGFVVCEICVRSVTSMASTARGVVITPEDIPAPSVGQADSGERAARSIESRDHSMTRGA